MTCPSCKVKYSGIESSFLTGIRSPVVHTFCVLYSSVKVGFLKKILNVYAGTVSKSLVNKVSLLGEVVIGMTDIGRNF